jgi:hypothetical protein
MEMFELKTVAKNSGQFGFCIGTKEDFIASGWSNIDFNRITADWQFAEEDQNFDRYFRRVEQ